MFHFRETYRFEEQTQFLLVATDVTTFFEFRLTSVYVANCLSAELPTVAGSNLKSWTWTLDQGSVGEKGESSTVSKNLVPWRANKPVGQAQSPIWKVRPNWYLNGLKVKLSDSCRSLYNVFMKLKHYLCDKICRETNHKSFLCASVHTTAWQADTHVGLTAGEHAGRRRLAESNWPTGSPTRNFMRRRGEVLCSCACASHTAKQVGYSLQS
jgi:hypothetical protein